MPLFWLRSALVLYGFGLVYALASLWGGRWRLNRVMLPALGLATIFHFVSLVEDAMLSDISALSSMHQIESLAAFLLMAFFFVIYSRFHTASPGVAVFPLVFLLSASAS